MADKTISIGIEIDAKRSGAGAGQAVNNLKRIEDQANKTREKMEKLAQIGTTLAMGGAAILAPLGLAMKKYLDTVKDAEPVSKRITDLSAKWEASQVRLGRIVATQVLPALEAGAATLDKIIKFAEENPGVVKAALTIGGTLIFLGGLITTTANLVKTVATIQALVGGSGLLAGGGGAAAGAAGGLSAATIAAGISAAIPTLVTALVTGLALVIGGQIGLGLGNALAGTNQTWGDIANTVKMLVVIVKEGWGRLFIAMGQWLQYLGRMIGDALKSVWAAIAKLFRGGRASGGYMSTPGLYAGAETGAREFVMSGSTTAAAERAIGGRLTQASALSMVTNNLNIGGSTIGQSRRTVRNNQRALIEGILSL